MAETRLPYTIGELFGSTEPRIVFEAVYELSWFCRLGGQTAVNVYHLQVSGQTEVVPPPTQGEALRALCTPLFTPYSKLLTVHATIHGATLRDVRQTTNVGTAYARFNPSPGTVKGDPLPLQVSGLISRRADLSGPRGRSRTFVPFAGAQSNDLVDGQGLPTLRYMDALDDLATQTRRQLPVNPGDAAWYMVYGLYRREQSQFLRFVTVTPRRVWATVRKRGSLGRPNPVPF